MSAVAQTLDESVALKNLFLLDGKWAMVTGAASGIGRTTANLLAGAGAKMLLADRDFEGVQALAQELGPNARALCFDLEDGASISAMFSKVAAEGGIDVLVNNAGIYPRYAFDTLTEDQWLHMQRTNVWGCFLVMRAAATLMRSQSRGGSIINVSSIGAVRTAVHDQIAYNASKAALDAMTLSAALELAPHGIRVNSVLPGAVRPRVARPKTGHAPAHGPLLDPGRIPLGRAAATEEVAGPILMLASAAGAYITGQTIIVDGGFSVS
jgi:NAD(P)-dependent dehydrogenase (short-subunit alcohol dehydrogenase family)